MYIFKVVTKQKVELGSSDMGLFETKVFYIRDVGGEGLSERIVTFFEKDLYKQQSGFNKDFFIKYIENLGVIHDLK